MYVRRRSVTPPDSGFPAALAPPYPQYRQRSLSPPSSSSMRDLRARHFALETLSRERDRLLDYYGMLDDRGRPYGFPPTPVVVEDLKPEDDQRATSNLFIGNLDGNVTEAELRRGFDKYGVIEDVVIKRPARGQGGAYAFVKFQNLDMAHRAKVAMQGRLMGGNPIKIGYGKANPTTRLWVGGLPSGNSLAALAREFDRFGSIRNIDYVKGDSFAYIQYESLDASQAACTQMRGFPLGGAERRLRVDFAKVMEESPPPPRVFPSGYQPPNVAPLSQHFEVLGETFSRHRSLEREMRGRERPSPPNHRERPSSPPNHRERPSSPPNHRERPSSPPNHRERPSSPPNHRERPASPPNHRERPSSPPNHRERPSSPPREKDFRFEPPILQLSLKTGGVILTQTPTQTPTKKTRRPPAATVSDPSTPPLNSSFPAELFLLEGGAAFFHASLKRAAAPPGQLKIAQRLRMDRTRLDEVRRRLKTGRPDGFSVLLALQGPVEVNEDSGLQARLLRHLVTYLRNKEAAGVVSLPASGGGPGAMLYAFPPGLFSQQYLQEAKRTVGNLDEEHMVVVIVSDTN
ncbi:hypothetical protein JOQ06_015157 [Pogonophryne albipinna]|uniref:RNA-binding protein 15B n=1 Tax=Pogonophryne albipinna TaxID=1090488 RepID=A0AAD6AMF0_9TELE|nr:hypothetical protein JOQ06_015157 [Pogonophryne albipinna]